MVMQPLDTGENSLAQGTPRLNRLGIERPRAIETSLYGCAKLIVAVLRRQRDRPSDRQKPDGSLPHKGSLPFRHEESARFYDLRGERRYELFE